MSRELKISLLYHPTTVVLIDDNENYLKQLSWFISKFYPCKIFTDPDFALDYLNQLQQESFADRYLRLLEEEELGRFSLKKEIRSIRTEMINPGRFSQVSVVIADYSMPILNGINFLEKINRKGFFKILLTGNADFQVATKAFNERKIDKFLKKEEDDLKDNLLEGITFFERQYFLNTSNIMLGKLDRNILLSLERKDVSDFFYNFIKEHNIVEYNIIGDSTDFHLFDGDGEMILFSIKSMEEIEKMYEWATIELSLQDKSKFGGLNKKEEIPLFSTLEDVENKHPEDWKLYPSKNIPGSSEYFYAYKKVMKQEGRTSFNKFLSKARENLG